MENKNLKTERKSKIHIFLMILIISTLLIGICFSGFVSAEKTVKPTNPNLQNAPNVKEPPPAPLPPALSPPPREPRTIESVNKGTATKTEYDEDGKPVKLTENKNETYPNGNVKKNTTTITEYDEDGKPVNVTENKTEFNSNGNKSKQTDTTIRYNGTKIETGKQTITYYCPEPNNKQPEFVFVYEYSKKKEAWVLVEYTAYNCGTGIMKYHWSFYTNVPSGERGKYFYISFFFFAVSLILFAAGYKTKNNLFYIAGVGSFLIAGGLYFLSPQEEPPLDFPEFFEEEPVEAETYAPIEQIDLLLTSADKNKNSGDFAAEKLDLMNALDISLKNNLTEKTEIIETKLSDTTRRDATEHRRFGNPEDAIKSADESIKYNSNNPWAYVEGIISSEESENHNSAVDYAEGLDKAEPAAETIADFPIDAKTADEYKNYAVTLNNNGTSVAKTAETEGISIGDAINAVKAGAEYLGEALAISKTLDSAGAAAATPTKTIISNLGSADINLIVLAAQAGDSKIGEDAINEASKLIADNPEVFPDDAVVKFKVNAGVFKAVVDKDYSTGLKFGMEALDIANKSARANNLIGSCLAIRGGEKNVKEAQPYLKKGADLDPANEVYKRNLKVVDDAIASRVYEGIDINFGVIVVEMPKDLITCCDPDKCIKTTVEKCLSIDGAVMECVFEMPPGIPLGVPAAPQNFTPLNISKYPDWWRNLTKAVNESPIVRDNWTYNRSANRTCMEFANNLTEYLRSRGFNATFTTYWWENDTNPNNNVPGHAVSDVYAPGGEKVFIEPQWAGSDGYRMQPPAMPEHYLENGTQVPSSSGMDADGDGAVEARNGQHSSTFAPTDDNVMIEQYTSRGAARTAGVPGA